MPIHHGGYPSDMKSDPGDCKADDELTDIEAAIVCALRRAVMGSGVKLAGQLVQVERVETVPFCDRKEIMVRPCFVLQVDGGTLDDIVSRVGTELAAVFSRVE